MWIYICNGAMNISLCNQQLYLAYFKFKNTKRDANTSEHRDVALVGLLNLQISSDVIGYLQSVQIEHAKMGKS